MVEKEKQQQLTFLCHPYFFALKEGNKIHQDPLDYSLLLLQRNCTEVICSPKRSKEVVYIKGNNA